mmetsp:Transcript_7704/g.19132  ORF Transcript_7704/g.19132 Transcript_7704/m.19132 type:complete len:99 (-) Transcript_7704:378-674(-)
MVRLTHFRASPFPMYMEDSGYTVDLGAADEFNGDDAPCCNGVLPNIIETGNSNTPPLSDAGLAAAFAHGREALKDSQRPANNAEDLMGRGDGINLRGR